MACKHQMKRRSFNKRRKSFRYVNHKKTFNNIKYETDIDLSNEYWNIRSANKTSDISWEILGTHKSYNQSSKRCLLCLIEKLASQREKCPCSDLFWSVFSRIQSEYGKIRTRITSNTDTFYAVNRSTERR